MRVFYWVVDNSILNLKRLLKEYLNGFFNLSFHFISFISNFEFYIFTTQKKQKLVLVDIIYTENK